MRGDWDRLLQAAYPYEIVECEACGLRRTLPVPDVAQYAYGAGKRGWSEAHTKDVWSAMVLSKIRRYRSRGRLLDVGRNIGNLVEIAAEAGFDAEGIDLDPGVVEEGRRRHRRVRLTPIEDIGGAYDVIVMNHVLEHVLDLRAFVGHVGRLLAPKGLIFVQVPYHRGLIPRLMGDHWLAWLPSQHAWHFTPVSLGRIFSDGADLAVVSMRTEGAIEPPSRGAKGSMKKALARLARRVNWGDEIEAVFGHLSGP